MSAKSYPGIEEIKILTFFAFTGLICFSIVVSLLSQMPWVNVNDHFLRLSHLYKNYIFSILATEFIRAG